MIEEAEEGGGSRLEKIKELYSKLYQNYMFWRAAVVRIVFELYLRLSLEIVGKM